MRPVTDELLLWAARATVGIYPFGFALADAAQRISSSYATRLADCARPVRRWARQPSWLSKNDLARQANDHQSEEKDSR